MPRIIFFGLALSCLLVSSCAVKPKGGFGNTAVPAQPDYAEVRGLGGLARKAR